MLSGTYSSILVIALLLLINCEDTTSREVQKCGCDIDVIGPYHHDRMMLICNPYSLQDVDYKTLKYSWLFMNTSRHIPDTKEYVVQEISRHKIYKFMVNSSIEGNYTCRARKLGTQELGNCTVSVRGIPPAPTEGWKLARVKTLHECLEKPFKFYPRPQHGIIFLEKAANISCVAIASVKSSIERNFSLGLGKTEESPSLETSGSDTWTPTLSPADSSSSGSSPSSETSASQNMSDKTCDFWYHSNKPDTVTISFAYVVTDCSGLYTCVMGNSLLQKNQSTVFVLYKKPANTSPTSSKHPRNTNTIGRIKRSSSSSYFGMKYNDTDDAHANEGEDDNDHHVKAKKKFDPTGVATGVTFLVLLVVAVVAGVSIWKKRMHLQQSRYMARKISGSKVPLFINKEFSSAEKSDLEEFPRKHIRFLDHIGKGTFGTVVMAETCNLHKHKKGLPSKSWTVVAVKMTLISEKSNEQLKKDFLGELCLMKEIPAHPNIITLHASCTAHDPYLMILEYAPHGDLRKFLLEHRTERNYANAALTAYGVGNRKAGNYYSSCNMHGDRTDKETKYENIAADEKKSSDLSTDDFDLITSRNLLSFALQVCRGLGHLSTNKIVHRDVAARNVLVCANKVVKISDFGLARKLGQEDVYERKTKGLLPIRWMSPESLFYNQFSEKSDVWSYGVLLWELITLGSTPYPGLDSTSVLEKIRHRELLICPPHSSTIVNDIVSKCWMEDSESRPGFSQLCQDLEKLLESEVEYLDLDQINDHEYSTLD